MAKLRSVLKADMTELTEAIRRKGRRNDTILAHISPREARILKAFGGSGRTNPNTGLPEFDPIDVGDIAFSAEPLTNVPITTTAYPADQTFSSPGMWTDQQLAQAQTQELPASFGALPTQLSPSSSSGDYSAGSPFSWSQPVQDLQSSFVNLGDVPLPPSRADAFAPLASSEGTAAINAAAGTPQGLAPASQQIQPTAEQQLQEIQQAGTAQGAASQKPTGLQGVLDKLAADPLKTALLLGGAGLGIYGNIQARNQAAKQSAAINALGQQQAALAQPFLTQGGTMYGQAVQGALTPTQRQAFDAARAQLAQAAASTGGVGAMQATALAENMRQQALQTQLNQGLQVLAQGDALMGSALQTQLQAINAQGQYAQQAANAAGNFFGALGKIYGSVS